MTESPQEVTAKEAIMHADPSLAWKQQDKAFVHPEYVRAGQARNVISGTTWNDVASGRTPYNPGAKYFSDALVAALNSPETIRKVSKWVVKDEEGLGKWRILRPKYDGAFDTPIPYPAFEKILQPYIDRLDACTAGSPEEQQILGEKITEKIFWGRRDSTMLPQGADPETFVPSKEQLDENTAMLNRNKKLAAEYGYSFVTRAVGKTGLYEVLNPFGPTGIAGGGLLGNEGANEAADFMISGIDSDGDVVIMAIQRGDTKEWAFPAGMRDKGESLVQTVRRELKEELSIDLPEGEDVVFKGLVFDPRNTDNRWMVSRGFHKHLGGSLMQKYAARVKPDGKETLNFKLLKITGQQGEENLKKMFASHGSMAMALLQKLAADGKIPTDKIPQVTWK